MQGTRPEAQVTGTGVTRGDQDTITVGLHEFPLLIEVQETSSNRSRRRSVSSTRVISTVRSHCTHPPTYSSDPSYRNPIPRESSDTSRQTPPKDISGPSRWTFPHSDSSDPSRCTPPTMNTPGPSNPSRRTPPRDTSDPTRRTLAPNDRSGPSRRTIPTTNTPKPSRPSRRTLHRDSSGTSYHTRICRTRKLEWQLMSPYKDPCRSMRPRTTPASSNHAFTPNALADGDQLNA
ncbi:hypothetical protein Ddye_015574 [Dipteronia dyeriana]|uniref:Uncharacterized protein n=1 Tax=Dipteronia dyeriana TaxID=168575 RepID=A0AAD9U5Y6_9ROSI|nr:hypothetical protein Ddye_015574 [Dipteronia dyeriana]